MNTPIIQGEVRPSITSGRQTVTSGDVPHHTDRLERPTLFAVPLLRLRGRGRDVIEPDDCRVKRCPVCEWRRAGLLSNPKASVVRESGPGYCVSDHCPGCGAWLDCRCPGDGYEDAIAEAAYVQGYHDGLADGPDNRPSAGWLRAERAQRWKRELDAAVLDPESYLDGYDAACAGDPPPATPPLPYVLPEPEPDHDWLPF